MIDFSAPGFSAEVRLHLVVGDRVVPIAKLGPDRCVLREPTELPRGAAELVDRIDAHEQRWPVFLPHGGALDSSHVEISVV